MVKKETRPRWSLEPTKPRTNIVQVFTKRNAAQFETFRDVTDQSTIWRLARGPAD